MNVTSLLTHFKLNSCTTLTVHLLHARCVCLGAEARSPPLPKAPSSPSWCAAWSTASLGGQSIPAAKGAGWERHVTGLRKGWPLVGWVGLVGEDGLTTEEGRAIKCEEAQEILQSRDNTFSSRFSLSDLGGSSCTVPAGPP